MDVILSLGIKEQKIDALLTRLGLQVVNAEGTGSIASALSRSIVDAIVWEDSNLSDDLEAMYELFRGTPSSKDASIVFAATTERASIIQELKHQRGDEKLEIVSSPYSVGTLITRLMTQLRLKKLGGASSAATLADANLALRDLNDRFRRELEEARSIQESLLPEKLPKGKGYEVSAYYKPLEDVGGDWYGAQVLPSGAIALQIADVTGHGIAAAFLGSMTRLALSAANKESPQELFTEMNRLLTPLMPSGRFISMSCLRFEPETGKLQFARAGHLPGLVVRKKEGSEFSSEQLKPSGFAMGFDEDGMYSLSETTLNVGDLFILCTDGITEGQNRSNVMLGMEGLAKLAGQFICCSSSQEIIDGILKEFNKFLDERLLKDDLTLVLLRRTG